MDDSIIPYLFGVTFALVIGFGIWQWWRARKARAEHHRSASALANGEPRQPTGREAADPVRR